MIVDALLTVAEMPGFQRFAGGLFTQEQLAGLISHLAADPTDGELIQRSGGLRKLRWGAKDKGKRGGARVVYFYHNDLMPLFLLTAYGKGRKDDISAAELKTMRQLTQALRDQYLGDEHAQRR